MYLNIKSQKLLNCRQLVDERFCTLDFRQSVKTQFFVYMEAQSFKFWYFEWKKYIATSYFVNARALFLIIIKYYNVIKTFEMSERAESHFMISGLNYICN